VHFKLQSAGPEEIYKMEVEIDIFVADFTKFFFCQIVVCNFCIYLVLFLVNSNMVLAPDFERQNISLVTEQQLHSAFTSFGLWPHSRRSVTKEIIKPFEK